MALDNVVCLESFIDNFAIIFENGDCIRELLPKTKKVRKCLEITEVFYIFAVG